MSEDMPMTETFGHGSITFTHYPSSGRVGVEQRGTNAVMDAFEFLRFAQRTGMLAAHDRQVQAEALRAHRRTVERWYANSGQKSLVSTAIVLGDLSDRADRIEKGEGA